ncbi:MAG: alpha/beta hydrolase family protein [Candidatus Omnitrophica bacterium]|nr:alpha/beta hydrolase family protein [Candidatus Omnitrophota bacterium]MCM8828541.1 alpha/beta hydrolase family protein [Candidatus Omnitrophota bacterium]
MKNEETRYTVAQHLLKVFDKQKKLLAFDAKNKKQFLQWKQKTRRKLKELIGYYRFRPCNFDPGVYETHQADDYIRIHMEIKTEPGVIMPLYVLKPKDDRTTYPVVIALHGHGSGGKYSVAGRSDIPEIAKQIEYYNYDYGVKFVKEGFLVFCPDARGFGERQEKWAKGNILTQSCLWLNNMAIPLGMTVTGMWTWDIHRLIDYILSRNDVDKGKIACAGLSGGGLQTLWASALDDRISCSVISGYMYGYKESLLEMCTNCSCNYVPQLYNYVDMGDIATLIAPRPLLVETGSKDTLNGKSGLKNVYSQVSIIKKAYSVLKAEKFFKHDVFKGEHRWHGKEAIPWVKKHLMQK